MLYVKGWIFGLVLIACTVEYSTECEIKQGCLIRNLVCSCGLGCASDYRYDSIQECQASLRGKKNDLCKTNNPCLHDGTCIQISQSPGFKCRCEGTGFYGMTCNKACPRPEPLRRYSRTTPRFLLEDIFPYECIEI